MATTTHGHLGEFDSTQEEWEMYIKCLEQYFTANNVQDAGKQRAILLSCCGVSTYHLIKNLLASNTLQMPRLMTLSHTLSGHIFT